jgi:DNA processing protein
MEILQKKALLLQKLRTGIEHTADLEALSKEVRGWEEEGIAVQIELPPLLTQVQSPPPLLFVKGQIPNKPTLAIVGTRKADPQALAWTKEIACELARHGNCIVSGLAYGIDKAAHEGALMSGVSGATVAVLAGGLRNIYPRAHEKLAERIIEQGGALVSIHEPSSPPLPHYFLERNQIISGLSLGTLVVQAASRSGSIATANAALDQGRELLTIPGSIFNPLFEGTNRLLKCGAHIILNLDDIFEAVPSLSSSASTDKKRELSKDEEKILQIIKQDEGISLHALIERITDLPAPSVVSLVTDLELNKEITIDFRDRIYPIKT